MAWLKCEYLQDRVGEEFPGVISGVTGFGLFVELGEVYATTPSIGEVQIAMPKSRRPAGGFHGSYRFAVLDR